MCFLELLVLPLWVGLFADAFSLPLLGSSVNKRLRWAAERPLAALALHL